MGYEQLVRFAGILGLQKPLHHKSFIAISRNVRDVAMDAISANLARSRELTMSEVGRDDIAIMYDDGPGSWCEHRRSEALGKPAPAHTPLLTKAQGMAILPIYKRLTN
ncbi:hypothetical protein HPB52_013450 [Rhipicephalus sanguineus]|uniref:Uncharacterized protein n=1 Tax=Rhipicephalus sanguineus TaxID=34632 RepID=A0A9D4PIX8_RHISA|nr:hypothetical protein HPB52_013450 [Rhipicephalus sanguineus]